MLQIITVKDHAGGLVYQGLCVATAAEDKRRNEVQTGMPCSVEIIDVEKLKADRDVVVKALMSIRDDKLTFKQIDALAHDVLVEISE